MNNKLHLVVTKTLLGTTLGIATGFLALAGTSSPSFAAAAKKPVAMTATHKVVKPKTTSTKPKTATKAKTSSKHAAKKHSTKHVAKHSAAKKSTAKKSTKHAVKSTAKKSTHVTVKPKTTVSKTKTSSKKK